MSNRRSLVRTGPPRHKWTAEQEHYIIEQYINILDVDMKEKSHPDVVTWSFIYKVIVKEYKRHFRSQPFVTSATIKYKVQWLKKVYDEKDTTEASNKKFKKFRERHEANGSWEDYERLIDHPLFRKDRRSSSRPSNSGTSVTLTSVTPASSSTSVNVTSPDPELVEAKEKFEQLKYLGLEDRVYNRVYPKLLDPNFRLLFMSLDTYQARLDFVHSYSLWSL